MMISSQTHHHSITSVRVSVIQLNTLNSGIYLGFLAWKLRGEFNASPKRKRTDSVKRQQNKHSLTIQVIQRKLASNTSINANIICEYLKMRLHNLVQIEHGLCGIIIIALLTLASVPPATFIHFGSEGSAELLLFSNLFDESAIRPRSRRCRLDSGRRSSSQGAGSAMAEGCERSGKIKLKKF